MAVRGVEHYTFVCSECRVTERRVVFIKDGRETDSPPMPMQPAPRIKRASTVQDEHVAAPGFLSRVLALVRGHRYARRAFVVLHRQIKQEKQIAIASYLRMALEMFYTRDNRWAQARECG